MTEEQSLISWDQTQRMMNEAKYQFKNWDPEFSEFDEKPKDEDEVFEKLCSSSSFFVEEEWNEFLSQLDEILEERNPDGNWKAKVKNFGWRNMDGYAEFHAENAQEFLRKILPNTDCTFFIYADGKHDLKIQNYHHDSPAGNEWYYVERNEIREN